ncbi:MAG: Lrp/AsnC family transcriptional regulator for asnA, asnC and gidA, partial [Woeseiaceae bacterium]
MKIDAVDEAIMAAFQEDGRQSNREVARKLEVSEGSIRQRLKKLQDGGAIRFDVVTDYAQMGIDFVALFRASVEPRHLERFLKSAGQLPELCYLAAVAGRFNIIAL